MKNLASQLNSHDRADGYTVAIALTPYEHILVILALQVARKERDIDPISMEAMVTSGDMIETLERL